MSCDNLNLEKQKAVLRVACCDFESLITEVVTLGITLKNFSRLWKDLGVIKEWIKCKTKRKRHHQFQVDLLEVGVCHLYRFFGRDVHLVAILILHSIYTCQKTKRKAKIHLSRVDWHVISEAYHAAKCYGMEDIVNAYDELEDRDAFQISETQTPPDPEIRGVLDRHIVKCSAKVPFTLFVPKDWCFDLLLKYAEEYDEAIVDYLENVTDDVLPTRPVHAYTCKALQVDAKNFTAIVTKVTSELLKVISREDTNVKKGEAIESAEKDSSKAKKKRRKQATPKKTLVLSPLVLSPEEMEYCQKAGMLQDYNKISGIRSSIYVPKSKVAPSATVTSGDLERLTAMETANLSMQGEAESSSSKVGSETHLSETPQTPAPPHFKKPIDPKIYMKWLRAAHRSMKPAANKNQKKKGNHSRYVPAQNKVLDSANTHATKSKSLGHRTVINEGPSSHVPMFQVRTLPAVTRDYSGMGVCDILRNQPILSGAAPIDLSPNQTTDSGLGSQQLPFVSTGQSHNQAISPRHANPPTPPGPAARRAITFPRNSASDASKSSSVNRNFQLLPSSTHPSGTLIPSPILHALLANNSYSFASEYHTIAHTEAHLKILNTYSRKRPANNKLPASGGASSTNQNVTRAVHSPVLAELLPNNEQGNIETFVVDLVQPITTETSVPCTQINEGYYESAPMHIQVVEEVVESSISVPEIPLAAAGQEATPQDEKLERKRKSSLQSDEKPPNKKQKHPDL